MKKLILSALMLIALSTPTLTHPIALKTVVDAGMLLANLVLTPEVLQLWGEKNSSTYRQKIPLTIAHLGLYFYTISALSKAYEERKNSGIIQVKK